MIAKRLVLMIFAICSFSFTVQAQHAGPTSSSLLETNLPPSATGEAPLEEKVNYVPPTTRDVVTAVGETARHAINMNLLLLTAFGSFVGIILAGGWFTLTRPIAEYKKSLKEDKDKIEQYKLEIEDELSKIRSDRENITINMNSQSKLQVAILFYEFLTLSEDELLKIDDYPKFKRKNIASVRDYIKEAWELKPTELWIKNWLYYLSGIVNGLDGKQKAACHDFKKCLELSPKHPKDLIIHYNLACALAQSILTEEEIPGAISEAIKHLEKALTYEPIVVHYQTDKYLNPIRNDPAFPKVG